MSPEREGPLKVVLYRCHGCKHSTREPFRYQSDVGATITCHHGDAPRHISHYSDRTPDWCPLLPKEKTE